MSFDRENHHSIHLTEKPHNIDTQATRRTERKWEREKKMFFVDSFSSKSDGIVFLLQPFFSSLSLCVQIGPMPSSVLFKLYTVLRWIVYVTVTVFQFESYFSGHQTLVLTYTDVFRCHGIAYSNLQDNIHNF